MGVRIYCPQAAAVHKLLTPADPGQGTDKGAGPQRMRSTSNTGLIWNRYLKLWSDDVLPRVTEGRDILVAFARDYNLARTERANQENARAQKARTERPLDGQLLEAMHTRQTQILTQWRGGGRGTELQRVLETRFATGLGSPHPTEVGFSFDRSIGVPYLPGSSVKGLARAAARLYEDSVMEETLFGPDQVEQDKDAKIGDLVFLDAYPITLPRLKIDIINCHHSRYYTGGSEFPSETEDPIPVYFLTVDSGVQWTFRLLSRSGEHTKRGAQLLAFGLKELGAGAKTAVGYGSFKE